MTDLATRRVPIIGVLDHSTPKPSIGDILAAALFEEIPLRLKDYRTIPNRLSALDRNIAFENIPVTSSKEMILDIANKAHETLTVEEYQEFILDPYDESGALISKLYALTYPDNPPPDSILRRALVTGILLAEPPAKYEEIFPRSAGVQNQALRREQRAMLYDQLISSANILENLTSWSLQCTSYIWESTSLDIYVAASQAAFGTDDPDEIDVRFSQSQRRTTRLCIARLISDIDALRNIYDGIQKGFNNTEFSLQCNNSVASHILGLDIPENEEVTAWATPWCLIFQIPSERYRTLFGATCDDIPDALIITTETVPSILKGRCFLTSEAVLVDDERRQRVCDSTIHESIFERFLKTSPSLNLNKIQEGLTKRASGQESTETDSILKTHQTVAHTTSKATLDDARKFIYVGARETSYLARIDDLYGCGLSQIDTIRKDATKEILDPDTNNALSQVWNTNTHRFFNQVNRYQWGLSVLLGKYDESMVLLAPNVGSEKISDFSVVGLVPINKWKRLLALVNIDKEEIGRVENETWDQDQLELSVLFSDPNTLPSTPTEAQFLALGRLGIGHPSSFLFCLEHLAHNPTSIYVGDCLHAIDCVIESYVTRPSKADIRRARNLLMEYLERAEDSDENRSRKEFASCILEQINEIRNS